MYSKNNMSTKLSWRDALKQFNDDRIKEGGKYSILKKGTPEYATVRKLMGDDIDAVELKPNQTITGQDPPAPVKQTRAKSRTPPKEKPADAPNKEKPQWVDEPKPVPKNPKEKEQPPTKMADEASVTAGLKIESQRKNPSQLRPQHQSPLVQSQRILLLS